MFPAIYVPFAGCDLFLDVFRDQDGLFREFLGKPCGGNDDE
jgi:hypothetical protein